MQAMKQRAQSRGEEIDNSVSHGAALVAALPLVERVSLPVIALLVAGGIAYTVGVVFFMLDSRLRYSHAVWHSFVAMGTGCHFFAVLNSSAWRGRVPWRGSWRLRFCPVRNRRLTAAAEAEDTPACRVESIPSVPMDQVCILERIDNIAIGTEINAVREREAPLAGAS